VPSSVTSALTTPAQKWQIHACRGCVFTRLDAAAIPHEVQPPESLRRYWTRRAIAEWLAAQLQDGGPALVGIDHGFSFPFRYFEQHALPLDWPAFLDDFRQHWPTDSPNTYVDFVREGVCGNGAARSGDSRWRRITELRARAKSVFHFNVPGSVAKSTHAGIPWLRYIRQQLGNRVHFWPFDGWSVPRHCSAIVEIYPALWNRTFPTQGRNVHQQDAFTTAEWLRRADADGLLARFFSPGLEPSERKIAKIEGWILGVG
jgi:hypothetical protein